MKINIKINIKINMKINMKINIKINIKINLKINMKINIESIQESIYFSNMKSNKSNRELLKKINIFFKIKINPKPWKLIDQDQNPMLRVLWVSHPIRVARQSRPTRPRLSWPHRMWKWNHSRSETRSRRHPSRCRRPGSSPWPVR